MLVRFHHSVVWLLRTARFAQALRCAHLFVHRLTPELMEKSDLWCPRMKMFWTTVLSVHLAAASDNVDRKTIKPREELSSGKVGMRIAEAEAVAVRRISRFRICGWDS